MKKFSALVTTAALLCGAATLRAQQADLGKILSDIRARDKGQLAISEEDGRFLRILIASTGRKHALEIGGASGYSAIWMAQGLRATGGKLVTIEFDPVRAKELAANISRAGMTDVVQVIPGDAFAEIPKLPGTFDFVFLDAWKRDYKKFLDLVYPRLDKGGLFTAHNVVNKKGEMGDFLDAVERNPSLWTAIVSPASEGISISYKK
ncbi:MAG TPA: class I SAM-dependent methyltransferase [Vicinamibacterales bacterium]|jgi:predicted O-methyltransferase YrrM|nr:class I SAM-dependent methyltransferase [Vicinamibacterales bacterium]